MQKAGATPKGTFALRTKLLWTLPFWPTNRKYREFLECGVRSHQRESAGMHPRTAKDKGTAGSFPDTKGVQL